MSGTFFHIIVIIAAIAGVVLGFRKGLLRQLAGLLGFGFGIVCCRLFVSQASAWISEAFPSLQGKFYSEFVCSTLAAVFIFIAVYFAFCCLARILKTLLSAIHVGVVNSVLGAAFGMLKYVFGVSLLFNLILCITPQSSLMSLSKADDGNVVELATAFAPALLGSDSIYDLAHKLQLKEAEKISCNFKTVSPDNQIIYLDAGCQQSVNID